MTDADYESHSSYLSWNAHPYLQDNAWEAKKSAKDIACIRNSRKTQFEGCLPVIVAAVLRRTTFRPQKNLIKINLFFLNPHK